VSYALVNAPTTDGYSPAATLQCGGSQAIALTVANAAVLYQLGHGIAAPVWDSEQFALPGVWTLPGADAIRIRSAAAGKPAQVSVSAF
jgi:hypothetical protein